MLKLLMLIALVGLTTAACPMNSTDLGDRCQCNSNMICATCPTGFCSDKTSVWGCNSSTTGPSFQYTSSDSSTNAYENCLLASEYCFTPSRTQSYSSYRPSCQEKYIGDFCIDTIFGSKVCVEPNATNPICPSANPVNGTYGPVCDYDNQIAGAVLALFEIILIAVGVVIALGCGCCLAMFFCGCMCFAGRNRSTVVVSGGPGYGSNGYNKV
eukprot:m.256150 g.256150  ORF g.256150 m.256150 type:complete len:212 (+) comp34117_c0_seq1:124-759(+)